MSISEFHLAHLPPSLAIYVAVYQDLKNALFLRQQLLEGNPEFEYAFVDADNVSSFSVYDRIELKFNFVTTFKP